MKWTSVLGPKERLTAIVDGGISLQVSAITQIVMTFQHVAVWWSCITRMLGPTYLLQTQVLVVTAVTV